MCQVIRITQSESTGRNAYTEHRGQLRAWQSGENGGECIIYAGLENKCVIDKIKPGTVTGPGASEYGARGESYTTCATETGLVTLGLLASLVVYEFLSVFEYFVCYFVKVYAVPAHTVRG